jgi:hypothetical protein
VHKDSGLSEEYAYSGPSIQNNAPKFIALLQFDDLYQLEGISIR